MAYILSSFILKLIGWKVENFVPPDVKKYIAVVAPHTSYWDFPLGIMARSKIRHNVRFIAKKEAFKFPFGGLLKWMGGYPVDRSVKSNMVEAVIDLFEKYDEFMICITPEGTRKKVHRFKTGFWHIAKGASVAFVLIDFDFEHKVVRFNEPLFPTEDKDADLIKIWNHFKNIKGKHPERGISGAYGKKVNA